MRAPQGSPEWRDYWQNDKAKAAYRDALERSLVEAPATPAPATAAPVTPAPAEAAPVVPAGPATEPARV